MMMADEKHHLGCLNIFISLFVRVIDCVRLPSVDVLPKFSELMVRWPGGMAAAAV